MSSGSSAARLQASACYTQPRIPWADPDTGLFKGHTRGAGPAAICGRNEWAGHEWRSPHGSSPRWISLFLCWPREGVGYWRRQCWALKSLWPGIRRMSRQYTQPMPRALRLVPLGMFLGQSRLLDTLFRVARPTWQDFLSLLVSDSGSC